MAAPLCERLQAYIRTKWNSTNPKTQNEPVWVQNTSQAVRMVSLFGSQLQDDKERTQTEFVRVLITRQERQMQNESVGIAITRQQESQMKTVCLGPNQKDNKEHMCRLTLFGYQSQDKTVTPSDTANRLKNFEMQQNLRYER